jgi:capsular polysaccharide biosynthesis protein
MDPAPIRRWNPGFIALRWRHLFWSLPLLGLLVGLVVHFLPMIRNTATGVVQIRPTALSFSTADVVHAVHTDDILALTGIRTDLSHRWNLKGREGGSCTEKLRRSVSAKPIPGTALVEISVSGRSRAESELIWHALVTALKEHFGGLRSVHDQTKLHQLEDAVKRQKADVDSKREALRRVIKTGPLLHYPNGAMQQPGGQFNKLKADFENSQKLLDQLQIKEISEKMQCRMMESEVTIIHEVPGTPVPVTLWDTLRPLVLHSSIGVGAGMVLAVVLAYLLELLFPRKAPHKP